MLTRLVAKSLVLVEAAEGETRYRMLETIREYAREKLAATGETEALQARHYAHFVAFAERVEPELRGRAQIEWGNRLEANHNNFRAALQWALTLPSANPVLRLAGVLHFFLDETQLHHRRTSLV